MYYFPAFHLAHNFGVTEELPEDDALRHPNK
jgi:hypothetical protein